MESRFEIYFEIIFYSNNRKVPGLPVTHLADVEPVSQDANCSHEQQHQRCVFGNFERPTSCEKNTIFENIYLPYLAGILYERIFACT